ncbi:MAG: bifunctional 2-C-methyl-D-erythritol 4-phosphate cytidylyltransferase/2-C-methyl-D-erythritol 2,4-cyclodiphosphate synthase [Alphaproteobacteria bacterium]|nr:bifunctional 2-C-methyl-D-erythritol 4-phosphate cytidylyltransferase/2-C-methyl-D-erythritol 2,4-cyclodiphosphate synthase [Alphaproteobacteria bacterium]
MNDKKHPKTIALLVAAGNSERMGSDLPKPYLQIGDKPLLRRTLKIFLAHPEVDAVRVVIRREHHPLYRRAIEGLSPMPMVVGGNTRQESVRLGLESLHEWQPERVLVHDVARPMVSDALISRVLATLKTNKGAVPALAMVDTVRRAKDGIALETIPRDGLFAVQTPQGFDYQTLLTAHQKLQGQSFTDDAALLEKIGVPVAIVEGDAQNIKITTQADIKTMQTTLSNDMETRTGMGYDVHVLKAHDSDTPVAQQYIKLCGIKIPFTHFLVGHSDADVGLHALVDAILGAIGDGDIGTHFPPDDRKWQGADSERFLLHAYELLKNRGGELVNMDVTLICERPKISVHREAMIDHLAATLKIAKDRISVKATTTEKLGFAGRGEGIAAQAVATVKLPRE